MIREGARMTNTDTLTRRQVISGALALSGAAPAIGQARHKRPNILFAIADDQSYLHTGAAGYKSVSTPAFDRLAQTGVRFTHSFCSSPSCTPSRGAILTGSISGVLRKAGIFGAACHKSSLCIPTCWSRRITTSVCRAKAGPGYLEPAGRSRNPAGPNLQKLRCVP